MEHLEGQDQIDLYFKRNGLFTGVTCYSSRICISLMLLLKWRCINNFNNFYKINDLLSHHSNFTTCIFSWFFPLLVTCILHCCIWRVQRPNSPFTQIRRSTLGSYVPVSFGNFKFHMLLCMLLANAYQIQWPPFAYLAVLRFLAFHASTKSSVMSFVKSNLKAFKVIKVKFSGI